MDQERDTRMLLHDLGNQLARILTSAELLDEAEDEDPAQRHRDLRVIMTAAIEGREIVRELGMRLPLE